MMNKYQKEAKYLDLIKTRLNQPASHPEAAVTLILERCPECISKRLFEYDCDLCNGASLVEVAYQPDVLGLYEVTQAKGHLRFRVIRKNIRRRQ